MFSGTGARWTSSDRLKGRRWADIMSDDDSSFSFARSRPQALREDGNPVSSKGGNLISGVRVQLPDCEVNSRSGWGSLFRKRNASTPPTTTTTEAAGFCGEATLLSVAASSSTSCFPHRAANPKPSLLDQVEEEAEEPAEAPTEKSASVDKESPKAPPQWATAAQRGRGLQRGELTPPPAAESTAGRRFPNGFAGMMSHVAEPVHGREGRTSNTMPRTKRNTLTSFLGASDNGGLPNNNMSSNHLRNKGSSTVMSGSLAITTSPTRHSKLTSTATPSTRNPIKSEASSNPSTTATPVQSNSTETRRAALSTSITTSISMPPKTLLPKKQSPVLLPRDTEESSYDSLILHFSKSSALKPSCPENPQFRRQQPYSPIKSSHEEPGISSQLPTAAAAAPLIVTESQMSSGMSQRNSLSATSEDASPTRPCDVHHEFALSRAVFDPCGNPLPTACDSPPSPSHHNKLDDSIELHLPKEEAVVKRTDLAGGNGMEVGSGFHSSRENIQNFPKPRGGKEAGRSRQSLMLPTNLPFYYGNPAWTFPPQFYHGGTSVSCGMPVTGNMSMDGVLQHAPLEGATISASPFTDRQATPASASYNISNPYSFPPCPLPSSSRNPTSMSPPPPQPFDSSTQHAADGRVLLCARDPSSMIIPPVGFGSVDDSSDKFLLPRTTYPSDKSLSDHVIWHAGRDDRQPGGIHSNTHNFNEKTPSRGEHYHQHLATNELLNFWGHHKTTASFPLQFPTATRASPAEYSPSGQIEHWSMLPPFPMFYGGWPPSPQHVAGWPYWMTYPGFGSAIGMHPSSCQQPFRTASQQVASSFPFPNLSSAVNTSTHAANGDVGATRFPQSRRGRRGARHRGAVGFRGRGSKLARLSQIGGDPQLESGWGSNGRFVSSSENRGAQGNKQLPLSSSDSLNLGGGGGASHDMAAFDSGTVLDNGWYPPPPPASAFPPLGTSVPSPPPIRLSSSRVETTLRTQVGTSRRKMPKEVLNFGLVAFPTPLSISDECDSSIEKSKKSNNRRKKSKAANRTPMPLPSTTNAVQQIAGDKIVANISDDNTSELKEANKSQDKQQQPSGLELLSLFQMPKPTHFGTRHDTAPQKSEQLRSKNCDQFTRRWTLPAPPTTHSTNVTTAAAATCAALPQTLPGKKKEKKKRALSAEGAKPAASGSRKGRRASTKKWIIPSEECVAARRRQIEIGRSTAEYRLYLSMLPKNKRKSDDPHTPSENSSRMSHRVFMDGIMAWRKQIRQFTQGSLKDNSSEDGEIRSFVDRVSPPAASSPLGVFATNKSSCSMQNPDRQIADCVAGDHASDAVAVAVHGDCPRTTLGSAASPSEPLFDDDKENQATSSSSKFCLAASGGVSSLKCSSAAGSVSTQNDAEELLLRFAVDLGEGLLVRCLRMNECKGCCE